ncbi:hypothetical protein [Haloarcula sp. 1CSR25-25]|jgi:transcription initiation factor TFIID TATA-box-binding protein|uniref:hypothetical protein n=1 Tax=Haloarcula sp. 1CSR25-25 TaxID=2862545 RepID=UPI0037C10119
MPMDNPQPALDLLVSLPSENRTVLRDWWVVIDGAEKGDDIRDYPEVWRGEDGWELPPGLKTIGEQDWVSIGHWNEGDSPLSLNAIAIGLGLDDIKYEPEQFSGLIYDPPEHSGMVYSFWETALAVGDTRDEASHAFDYFMETLERLDLTDGTSVEVETKKVSNVIS